MQDQISSTCLLEEVLGQSSEDYFRTIFGMNDVVLHEEVTSTQTNNSEQDDRQQEVVNYRTQYEELKKKLKDLIKDNELFRHQLSVSERKLLKVTHDRSFLLDRLLAYELPSASSSSSSSDSESDTLADKNNPVSKGKPNTKRCKRSSYKQ